MPAPHNPFKSALQDGTQQIGLWLALANAYTAEVAAHSGFDWLLVDGEHAPNDIRSVLAQVQAIQGVGSHPVVRTPDSEPWMIKQLLDIGVQSILVPMVESVDQARSIVAATRYAPQGKRGVGAGLARASHFNGISDYIGTAADQICVLLQVETRMGLRALDALIEMTEVGGIFIGPADLAADLGYPGQPAHPEVQVVVTDALERIIKAGKASGILSSDPALLDGYIDMGVRFVAVGSDVGVLAGGLRSLRARFA